MVALANNVKEARALVKTKLLACLPRESGLSDAEKKDLAKKPVTVRENILYAISWALIMQQILETELNFNYNDQTVTLGYHHDRAGMFGSINAALVSSLQEQQTGPCSNFVGARTCSNKVTKKE